eukprot:2035368-Prymnesium_polylepis.2
MCRGCRRCRYRSSSVTAPDSDLPVSAEPGRSCVPLRTYEGDREHEVYVACRLALRCVLDVAGVGVESETVHATIKGCSRKF